MEIDQKTLELADRMLAEMGLSPVTVPGVLNGNRVPDRSQSASYREVEDCLLEHGFVLRVERAEEDQTPGYWELLQISETGYDMVQEGQTVSGYLTEQQRMAKRRSLEYAARAQRKKEERQAKIDAGLIPQWWIDGNGEWLVGEFDPEEEKPLWWAKYRLRRIREFPSYASKLDDHVSFPEKWWEKAADYLFRNTGSTFQIILGALLLVGLVYAAVFVLSLG